ncbi:hypothetical protein D3C76_995070 [compost metagenome]
MLYRSINFIRLWNLNSPSVAFVFEIAILAFQLFIIISFESGDSIAFAIQVPQNMRCQSLLRIITFLFLEQINAYIL